MEAHRKWFYMAATLVLAITAQVVILVIVVLNMIGCAEIPRPYVTIQPVGPVNELAWFEDGPPVIIVVHNPTADQVSGILTCRGGSYTPSQPITLAPHSEWRAFGQVLQRDLHATPCTFKEN